MSADRDGNEPALDEGAVAVRLATFYALGAAVRRGVDFRTAFALCNEGWDESEREQLARTLAPKGGFFVGPRAGVARDSVSH